MRIRSYTLALQAQYAPVGIDKHQMKHQGADRSISSHKAGKAARERVCNSIFSQYKQRNSNMLAVYF